MPESSIDSLSAQPKPSQFSAERPSVSSPLGAFSTPPEPTPTLPPSDSRTSHVDIPPIGPASGGENFTAAPPSSEADPTEAQQTPPFEAPRAAPSDPLISSAVTAPVIETHKGPVPVPPVAGVKAVQAVQATVSAAEKPLAQRPAYLWLLLGVGVLFLILLGVVYFGGVYTAQ
jgi:hypothetical protein